MKENRYKGTLETLYIYDLPRNSYEAATLRKPSNLTKKNQTWKIICVDKVINVVKLLV